MAAEWVEVGQQAPAFSLQDDHGQTVTLAGLRGKPVVLYFYPKDDTPGCTRQACAFRDKHQGWNAAVLGVSPDDEGSHGAFRDKFSLNFPLLVDPGHTVAERYGAWREKVLYGKKSIGIQRSTFLIDKDGTVARVWKKVSVDGHDEQVAAAIAALP